MFIDMILARQNFHRILIVHIMILIMSIHYGNIIVHMMEWKFSQISMSIIFVHDLINAMIMFKKFSQTPKVWALKNAKMPSESSADVPFICGNARLYGELPSSPNRASIQSRKTLGTLPF